MRNLAAPSDKTGRWPNVQLRPGMIAGGGAPLPDIEAVIVGTLIRTRL
jgi:hypothetical protein